MVFRIYDAEGKSIGKPVSENDIIVRSVDGFPHAIVVVTTFTSYFQLGHGEIVFMLPTLNETLKLTLKVRTGRPKINHDPDLDFFRDKNYRVGTLFLIDLKPGTPRFRHSNYMEIFRDYD